MSLSVPLVTIKSKTMSFPVQLNYQAGITVDQQSGAVGLGWNLPFGSIVRDYGAFDPDYTSSGAEVDMENANGGIDGWIELNNVSINPYNHHKSLQYNLTSDMFGGGVPDKYHVSVPGALSNTFWNESTTGLLEWGLKDNAPWKVEHEVNNFVISQEFSRINEANMGVNNAGLLNDKDNFNNEYSYAAAIGLLPYVKNGQLWNPNTGGAFNPQGEDRLVKYDDFGSFTISDDNGTKFVFGRPLRGQKFMFSEDPYWSTTTNALNSNMSNVSLGNFWKIDYIAEWLLTEIRSADYVDVNNNGIADEGDTGDWIRIEYTTPTKSENQTLFGSSMAGIYQNVPSFREWNSFSQTDRASSLMRERAYVTKIITPVQEVDFTISKRKEVDFDYYSKPANKFGNGFFYEDRKYLNGAGSSSDFDILFPLETMKYDTIKVIDKSRNEKVYRNEDLIQNVLVLNYADKGSAEELAVSNYLIRDNNNVDRALDKPSDGVGLDISKYITENGCGKTTLLGVDIFTSDLDPNNIQSYEFDYGYNPSYSEIHKRSIVRKKIFPSLRQSYWAGNLFFDPVSINKVNYYTENSPVILSVLPYDFLIDAPYEETYKKIIPSITSSLDLFNLINTNWEFDDIEDESFVVESLNHDLYPVEDAAGYFNDPDSNPLSRSAWSLTKIKYPTQGEVSFEYENDEGDFDAEEWLPLLKEYNELAGNRSLIQSFANKFLELYDTEPLPRIVKTLTASFDIPTDQNIGGIRLKSKKINDGINQEVTIDYHYGSGHHIHAPTGYVNNLISGINSFYIREKQRHRWEMVHFDLQYTYQSPGGFTNDYENRMKYFAFSQIFYEPVRQTKHFYEYIEQVYSDGSKTKNHFNTIGNATNILNGDDENTYYPGGIAPFTFGAIKTLSEVYNDKFCFAENENSNLNVYLYKSEKFNSGNNVPFQTSEKTLDVESFSVDLLSTPSFPANTVDGYLTSHFSTYIKLINDYADPYYWKNAFSLLGGPFLRVGTGSFAMIDSESNYDFGAIWFNSTTFDPRPTTFVNLVRYNLLGLPSGNEMYELTYEYKLKIPEAYFERLQKYRINTVKETSNYKGIETENEYTYNWSNGYLTEESMSSDEQNVSIITKYEYAEDVYGGVTNKFSDLNILRPVIRKTSYLDNVNNSNVLSADFTTWNYNLVIPKPESQYYFKTENIDNNTGKFTITPYSISGTNVSEWTNSEASIETFNEDNAVVCSRSNQIYNFNVLGFNNSISKANISWPGRSFDATYTGFEDLNLSEDIPIGSKNIKEWWYYNVVEDALIEEDAYLAYNTNSPCNNSILYPIVLPNETIPQDLYIFIKVLHSQNNGQTLFNVGDQVSVDGILISTGGAIPTFSGTITAVNVNNNGGYTSFCFNTSLPSVYGSSYLPIENMTISKIESVQASNTSSTYKRTGKYSYRLEGLNGDEPENITPIRPVFIEKSVSIDANCSDPIGITGTNPIYNDNCYNNYEASVWLKHDYKLPRLEMEEGPLLPNIYGGMPYASSLCQFADDFANTYYRGEVTTNSANANTTVKIVYKVWNNARTNIISTGEFYLENLNSNWQQYKIDIPILKSTSDKQVDVYVVNDMQASGNLITEKSVYVDDLIIYPKGAKYNYQTINKFGEVTYVVDNNDVFERNRYDEFGRLLKSYDGYGRLVMESAYNISNDLSISDNHQTDRIWVDYNKSSQKRVYKDGFGETKQEIIVNHEKNASIISKSLDFDEMGRATKEYKSYPKQGAALPDKHYSNYAIKSSDFYQTNTPFSEVVYEDKPGAIVSKTYQPKLNSESSFESSRSDEVTLTNIGGVFGIPVYSAGELLINSTIDAEGNEIKTYTNRLGQVVLAEKEIGLLHTQNADGSLSFTGANSNSKTYFKYDKLGRLINTIDPDGKETLYIYNSIGQVIITETPDRGQSKVKYDKYNQARFIKSQKDLETISDPNVIDQFKYVKYDEWGRVLENGLMKEMPNIAITNSAGITYTPQVVFDNQIFINDQDYPYEIDLFNELHYKYEYGESRHDFNSQTITKTEVNSKHTINDYQFMPSKVDKNNYTYFLNGTVKDVSYELDGLSGVHIMSYVYNRMNLPILKTYTHPYDQNLNFKWLTNYNDFGAPITHSSGNLNDMSIVSTFDYDVLGNLRSEGLGSTSIAANPFIDKVLSKINIRDQVVSQLSNNFRLGLSYNKNGQISDQYWSNEPLGTDATTGSSVNVNRYHYYYDKMNRMIGADYRTQIHNNNPFDYFNNINYLNLLDFDCTLVDDPQTDDELELEMIDIQTNGGNGEPIGNPNEIERAAQGLFFVKANFDKNPVDFSSLEVSAQNEYLTKLHNEAIDNNVDIRGYELLKAKVKNDQEHKILIESSYTNEATNGEIDAQELKYTKLFITKMYCETSGGCQPIYASTAYGLLNDFPIEGTETNANKYDVAVWYSNNSNINVLNRTNMSSVKTEQNYAYNNGSSNQLSSVDFYISGTSNIMNYTYDVLGNIVTDNQNSVSNIEYTPFNDLPIAITNPNGIKKYRYDINGIRSVKEIATNDIEYYIDGVIINQNEEVKSYQTMAGHAVPNTGDNTVDNFYIIKDWLGTVRQVVGETAIITSARDHFPYGKLMDGRNILSGSHEDSRYQYTGHEFDVETNYGYHGARYYNREIGKYMSIDPLAFKYPSLSDYCYVAGNPINYIDPTGMLVETRYKDKETGELIKDVDDGYDVDTYVDRKQFDLVFDYAIRSGADFTNKAHAMYFTGQYNSGAGGRLDLYKSFFSDAELKMKYESPLYTDPAGGTFVHVEVAILELITIQKYLGAAYKALKYAFGVSTAANATVTYSQATFRAFQKQLQEHGRRSILRSQSKIQRRLQEHLKKLSEIKKAGGHASSVEREINTFRSQLKAIDDLIK